MDNLYILLFIIGGCLAAFGALKISKVFLLKVVAHLPLSEAPAEVTFTRPGVYTLVVLGLQYMKNVGGFGMAVTGTGGRNVPVTDKKLKIKSFYKGQGSKEYLQFKIDTPGKYIVQLQKPTDLRSTGLQLFVARGSNNAETASGFLIRETLEAKDFIIAVLALAVGLNLITLGILAQSGVVF